MANLENWGVRGGGFGWREKSETKGVTALLLCFCLYAREGETWREKKAPDEIFMLWRPSLCVCTNVHRYTSWHEISMQYMLSAQAHLGSARFIQGGAERERAYKKAPCLSYAGGFSKGGCAVDSARQNCTNNAPVFFCSSLVRQPPP